MSDTVKVKLPPGCVGFDTTDGRKLNANKPGGTIEVSQRDADAINKGQYGQTGFISAKGAQSFGTKKGQLCPACGRIWNAWNKTCPKCEVETTTI
jgi:hypothetical protein